MSAGKTNGNQADDAAQCYPGLPAQTWYYTNDNYIAVQNQGQCLDLTSMSVTEERGLVLVCHFPADSFVDGNTSPGNIVQTWQVGDLDCLECSLHQFSSVAIGQELTRVPVHNEQCQPALGYLVVSESGVRSRTGTKQERTKKRDIIDRTMTFPLRGIWTLVMDTCDLRAERLLA